MPRLTIRLTDRTHRALKEAAARQGRSMGALIEESLELRGILPTGYRAGDRRRSAFERRRAVW